MATRVQRLLAALVKPFQTFQDAATQVLTQRSIEDATGQTLTMLGGLVGQQPIDVDEDTFRAFVSARVRTNRSSGIGDQILRIVRLVLSHYAARPEVVAAGTMKLLARNLGLAGFSVEVQEIDLDWTLATIAADSFLEVAAGVGIGAQLVFFTQHGAVHDDHSARPFLLGDVVSGLAPGGGWGDSSDATTGGVLAAVLE